GVASVKSVASHARGRLESAPVQAATQTIEIQAPTRRPPPATRDVVFEISDVSVSYGTNVALAGVTLDVYRTLITAIIGPSGCGKSTFIRALNRMHEISSDVAVGGRISYLGHDVYGPDVDPVQVRRHIGMVFQKPNPFPMSIYDNIAFG